MNEDNLENCLFIMAGITSLYIGLKWKKPSYGGGVVHKYALIILGCMSLLYGIVSILGNEM